MTIQANFPAIKPSLLLDFANTKQLDSRITYTRASTATYYNGVTTAMAEQNLFLNSQNITTSGSPAYWNVNNSTNTANSSTAPDGTSTATLILPTNTAATSFTTPINYSPNATGTVTISIYVKPNTYVNFGIREQNITGAEAAFACTSTGSVLYSTAGSGTGFSATITQSTNGFYRCSITVNVGSGLVTSPRFFVLSPSYTTGALNSATWTSNGTDGMYFWGAQLEQRSAVSAYTVTTTQAITNYIPVLQTAASGVARFDNNPTTGESLGLLIEESRTNLILYSEQFDNASWTKSGSSVSANAVVAPDGNLTADRIIEDTSTGAHIIYQAVNFTSGTAYTYSIYAKAQSRSKIRLYNNISGGPDAIFDLSSGTVTTTAGTSTITAIGNSWYRCAVAFTAGTTVSANCQVQLITGTSTSSYTGDGWSGVYLWGSVVEAGAFATSYIPTVASQVTRAADAASMTGTNFSSWFNTAEGTFYGNAAPISLTGTYKILSTTPVAAGSFLTMSSNGGSSVTGWYAAGLGSLGTTLAENKLVAKYNTAKYFGGVMNGGTVVESTSSDFAGLATTLAIGQGSASYMNGTIKKIAYYPIRLTNAQIQALTS